MTNLDLFFCDSDAVTLIDSISVGSDIGNVVTALAAVAVAIKLYYWSRANARAQHMRESANLLAQVTATILSDKELQGFQVESHPFGDLKATDVKKMYMYFTMLNIARYSVEEKNSKLFKDKAALNEIANFANITFKD